MVVIFCLKISKLKALELSLFMVLDTFFWSDPNPPTLAHSAYSYGPEGFGGGSGQWIIANDTAKVLPEENINGELFLFRLQGPLEYSRAPTYWDFFQTNE